jgi:GNAT superfamily N-acetyltransferase
MSTPTPVLLDLHDYRRPDRSILLNDFIALYRRTFTDPSEREDPDQWSALLQYDPAEPQPRMHLLVAVQPEEQGTVRLLAGLAFEYYRSSRCGLLTYLAVEPDHRHQGLARTLIARAIEILKNDAQEYATRLRAVFSETEDPDRVAADGGAISPRDRLTVLGRLGARWIDIPYVQPTLVGGDGRCRHLLLLAFYHNGPTPDSIEGAAVRDFLHEFYRALGVDQPQNDPDFINQRRLIGATLPLKPLTQA